MKKLVISLFMLPVLTNVFGQNTWDGSNTTITTNGNVGIGGTSTTSRLYLNNTTLAHGFINNSTNGLSGTQYGLQNIFNSSATSGIKYGIFNSMTNTTSNSTYGVYTTNTVSGTGAGYGIYSQVSGANSGTKYALYAYVPNTSAGTRYGIYADARGTGARAGLFNGDLETRGNVIVSNNNQSRFVFHTSWNSDPIANQWLQIAPNVTSGSDDWNFNNSLTFFNNGLLQKGTATANLAFSVKRTDLNQDVFRVYGDGKVYATEVNVRIPADFPDYVFSPSYSLRSLSELETFIIANKHLPNIPSAETVEKEGVNIGELSTVLVEKIEELTLYIIEQEKRIKLLESQLNELNK